MKTSKLVLSQLSFCYVLILVITSCKQRPVIQVDAQNIRHVKVDGLEQSKPLGFDSIIHSVRYVLLENSSVGAITIDKIVLNGSNIYIEDKVKSLLLIYNLGGELKSIIKQINTFDIYKNNLYTYNIQKGIINTYSLRGAYLRQYPVGFRGVDFINLNDSVFVFNTAGLVTKDKGSTHYELAYVHQNGRFDKFAIPISEMKQSVNYAATGRFSRLGSNVYFIPSLENQMYLLKSETVLSYLEFNFGKSTLTDQAFKTFKELEDYNFFPYIINITNRFNTGLYSFFTCSYKGKEAYFIVERANGYLVTAGLSGMAGIHSDFNNTIPQAFIDGEYVSVIENSEFKNNYNLLSGHTRFWQKSSLKNLTKSAVVVNTNPVLMFFKTKQFTVSVGKPKVDLR